jgi:hypothetical protein
MHQGSRAIVVCSLAALSAAATCHEYMAIKAAGDPVAPTFELERATSCREVRISIREFDPVEKEYGWRPIWEIAQSASDAVRVHRFTYGEPPSGFRVYDGPQRLIEGRSYHVSLRCGRVFGNGRFKLNEVAGHLELENIDAP